MRALLGLALLVISFLEGTLQPRSWSPSGAEEMLSTDNAYNPIPSPDGKHIAYVGIGFGKNGDGGFGRSNLDSEIRFIDSNGRAGAKVTVGRYFLSGWTPDNTNVVCYRDGNYAFIALNGDLSHEGQLPAHSVTIGRTERVSYTAALRTVVWSVQDVPFHTVLTSPSAIVAQHGGWLGALIAPSPNGRYLAIAEADAAPVTNVWIYDTELKGWAYQEKANIHPDPNWDYIKPSWNPWFADSSRIAVFTHHGAVLSVITADGRRRTDIPINGKGGLATPSPDGEHVAYVSFEPRPRKLRPDLQFWGGTRIWVMSLSGTPAAHPITIKSQDETYDLRWLNRDQLVFDRIADVPLYRESSIWKVDVPH